MGQNQMHSLQETLSTFSLLVSLTNPYWKMNDPNVNSVVMTIAKLETHEELTLDNVKYLTKTANQIYENIVKILIEKLNKNSEANL